MRTVKISEKQKLNDITYKFTMANGGDAFVAPGQYAKLYVNGTNDGVMAPVAEYDSDRFIIILRVTDEAGKILASYEPGTMLEAELGLGDGFDIEAIPDGCVLAAEGIGIPSLLGLMRQLLMYGKDFRIVLGYDSMDSVYMLKPFETLASNLEIVTVDGSNGRKGHVSRAIHNEDYVCACASEEVLKELLPKTEDGQFALLDNAKEAPSVYTRLEFVNKF